MKIIPGKYKEERDWQKWVKFTYAHGSQLNVVFLWRLAALARDYNHIMDNVLGYRPKSETQRLWDADIKANEGKPSGRVAEPGTSFHEFYLAVDLDGDYWKSISKTQWITKTRLNQSLNEYGLILPLNKIDSPSIQEWWHIQPIETATGIEKYDRKNFLDPDDVIWGQGGDMILTDFQKAMAHIGVYKGKVDNKAGPLTKAAAEECLPMVLDILGLEDPRKIRTEYVQLRDGIMNLVDKMGGKV